MQVFVALDAITLILALASLMLTLKAVHKALSVYRFARRRLKRPALSDQALVWDKLTIWDKMTFFSWWLVS